MINVQQMILMAMKKELFPNNAELNLAARNVLGEMKTKYIDIKGEITIVIPFKHKDGT